MNLEINRGTTRWVLLIGNYAFKFPRIHVKRKHAKDTWKCFLLGLIANMRENEFGRCGFSVLCPVVFRIPGGFLTVMPRAKPLPISQWIALDIDALFAGQISTDLIEKKKDSFGILNGNIVAVDYG